ncbi:MAG: type IV pili twitching motility protein PilT [Zetaproteobacteria bacterium CG_4_9_14_3_um_filter_49_83]|nr:MAG: type IV pili twitching motility protein PilT [Zetaproteobacteria bacterium CG1_02_49_23]PIQ32753.1 MAG: type IV pili twitching motility protein PilT [Zetaproteobacteria bacterium CG17_big_fil_post_rev_8_21_14_2_50_50_13]PIV29268.1 MAG: type IV pili twitching motility protein PilT [Zetaproteobacteria bacterium CG02_land_8_20_14_3_00_50_9]PIY54934.1 MAG: type IV pili twitching motility protein PilT [Zetaproteobacteria bacterium CG_4_10_14_0_8_um_filter_49_80]PJA35322.1 MAG: type IV pili t
MNANEPKKLSIKQLLMVMVKKDASDLYITSGLPPAYRINNSVIPLKQDPLSSVETEQLANATMSEKQRAAFSTDMEMNLALAYEGMGRFRVNIFRQRGDIGMVIRKITTDVPTLEQLGLPEVFKDIVMNKRGLVIMVGATSSGKSTSLAAMIDYRNRNSAGHIITIEDPVEFVHQHRRCVVTQREVGTDTITFKAALKNTLRQAPDVILVGEIRDRETMEHALEFAETGHLCMATLHANNSNQALERVLNFFPEEVHPQIRLNLSMNLKAILSQRLARTIDGGRKAAIEILINTPRIADQIEKWEVGEIKETMAAGGNYGMQTFDQCLLNLWKDGFISEDEAQVHADAVNDLRLKMKMTKLESRGEDSSDPGMLTGGMDDDSELKI